jgi:hypothetical protein
MNPIKKYVIREPGCTAWAETRGTLEGAARRLKDEARAAGLAKAQIYAEHENGDITGPYIIREDE